jgi:hypothetical protein
MMNVAVTVAAGVSVAGTACWSAARSLAAVAGTIGSVAVAVAGSAGVGVSVSTGVAALRLSR